MFKSTKIIELGSCAFRQPSAESHCKYLHGYRLTAKFWFEAESLDQNNWVVDFGGLKELKNTLQNQFDHTTCISKEDPRLDEFNRLQQAGVCDLRVMDGVGIEKFAEWCYGTANRHVHELTNSRCKCVKVEVFEHESNSAIYEPTNKPTLGDQELTDFMGNKDVQEPPMNVAPRETAPVVSKTNISSNSNKLKNKWVNPDAPKNSWLF